MNPKVAVLVAECEPVVRFGITEFLRKRSAGFLCADSDSVPSARAHCEAHKPDLLLVNPELTGGDGFSLIHEASRWNEKIRIVAFTPLDDTDSMIRAFRAGALAYVTRLDPLEELGVAIDAALLGNEYMSTRVQRGLYSEMRCGRIALSSDPTAVLSARERQIFHLLGEGQSKQDISRELRLSPKTVDSHQQRMKTKLGIASYAELRKHAIVSVNQAAAPVLDPRTSAESMAKL